MNPELPAGISQEIEEPAKQEVCGDGHVENSAWHSHVDPIGLTFLSYFLLQLQGVFGVHGVLGIEVRKHYISQETTLVTAVLEFPQNVNSSVINVYDSASDNRSNQSTPLFVSSTVLYGHRPTGTIHAWVTCEYASTSHDYQMTIT